MTWELGNNPTKVLYNCRKVVQLQFNFTTAKKCTTAISFHNCNFFVGTIEKKSQLQFHFTTAKKLYNCKTNAQQQKNVQLQNKFIAMRAKENCCLPFFCRCTICFAVVPCILQLCFFFADVLKYVLFLCTILLMCK